MNPYILHVAEFMWKAGQEWAPYPRLADMHTNLLRAQLIQEELAELLHAMAKGDHVGALDALSDLQYVLSGTVLALGFHEVFDDAFMHVHESNMSKMDPEAILDKAGRVQKGPNYWPPRLEEYVDRAYK